MDTERKTNYCSLLTLGKTGTGKSTFLNLLAGSQVFKTSNTLELCTKDVICHPFTFDDFVLIGFDTPGSDGFDNCQVYIKIITDFLKNFRHFLNAIAIVITASNFRFDINFQILIKILHNIFGYNNIGQHICFIVTHSPVDQEDINILKKSMTTDEYSLKSSILQMIKNLCSLNFDPELPFFFFDSRHPNSPSSKESLPQFKAWLKSRPPFEIQDLENRDVEWQYKETKHETKTTYGPRKPIFEILPGKNGEMMKKIRGFYQNITSIVKTYAACWPYGCNDEYIKNKKYPIEKDFEFGEPTTTTYYFDENMNKLDPEHQSDEIENLKAFRVTCGTSAEE